MELLFQVELLNAFFEFVVIVVISLKLVDECTMNVAVFVFDDVMTMVFVFTVLLRYVDAFLPRSTGVSLISDFCCGSGNLRGIHI